MSTKTKILVSVSVISLVIAVALVAVVAVFAATNQIVTSTVSVSYKVEDVIGSCQASYRVANSASFTEIGTINFEAADENNKQQAISGSDLTLTSINNYVEFRYKFINASEAISGKDYTITLTYSDDKIADKNVSIEYSFGGSSDTSASYGSVKTEVEAKWSNHPIGTTKTVAKNSTYYVFVKISITNLNYGAAFSGDFKWTIAAVK